MNKNRNISIQSELEFKETNITKVAGLSDLLARFTKRRDINPKINSMITHE